MKKDIDILLVYPRPTKDSPVKLTPLSILFPGALLKSQGLNVEYFDQRFDSSEELHSLISRTHEIGVSVMTGYQCGQAAKILTKAKEIDADIITGVGGHHARIFPEHLVKEAIVDKVWPNAVYGEDLFPYDEQTKKHFARTTVQYMTSRGCPFGCRFCALTTDWVPYDLDRLSRELTIMHNDLKFDWLSFSDPNIGHYAYKKNGKQVKIDNLQRVRDIGQIMRDLNVFWESNLRSPLLSEEMIEALVSGNCTDIEIGCESGNERVLRTIVRKGHSVEAIKRAAKNVAGSGLSVMYSFLAFMPGETMEDIHDTMDLIDFIVDTDPEARISIYKFAPYPGTPMYQDAIEGKYGYPKFVPPKTLQEWGELKLMAAPIYWIAGLNFRMDNSRKNFPGEDWKLIEPYIDLAREKWQKRDILTFPCDEVEKLIEKQVRKFDKEIADSC